MFTKVCYGIYLYTKFQVALNSKNLTQIKIDWFSFKVDRFQSKYARYPSRKQTGYSIT